ncbi:hypothetical protein HK102_013554 [Quaeritorhiza haematococci]|nr:hypothetical protein HK102_013554 [Quaeritorhiza haematococci]
MVSTIFLSPSDSAQVDRTKNFTVTIKTLNMQLGNFDNPQTQYFMSPQTLTSDGVVIGHQHVVIQRLPDPNPTAPLDPREFDFFRGLDFQPESGNLLSVTVPAGTIKRDGVYRMCTLTGTKGHQPVIMPVAQRGAQDDCIRVEMISGNGSNLVSEQPPVQQGSGSDAIPPSGGAPAPAALAGAGSVPAAATPGTPNLVEVLRDLIEQGIQLLG